MEKYMKKLLNEEVDSYRIEKMFPFTTKPSTWEDMKSVSHAELSDYQKSALEDIPVFQIDDVWGHRDDLPKSPLEYFDPIDELPEVFAVDDGEGSNILIDRRGYDYGREMVKIDMSIDEPDDDNAGDFGGSDKPPRQYGARGIG